MCPKCCRCAKRLRKAQKADQPPHEEKKRKSVSKMKKTESERESKDKIPLNPLLSLSSDVKDEPITLKTESSWNDLTKQWNYSSRLSISIPHSWLRSAELDSILASFLSKINQIRVRRNLNKIRFHPILNRCAAEHNYDQAFIMNAINHEGSDGSRSYMRAKALGYQYRWIGENVAHRQKTVPWVINSLMKSPGHKKNIVNCRAVHMGVHAGIGADGDWFWTQILAAPKTDG